MVLPCFNRLFSLHNVTDFRPAYVSTSTTVLSANPSVAVPLLTINGWILMQRKVKGGSLTFEQNWVPYRDGFGLSTGNDNYWLGLEKVYRFVQLGNVRLRIEASCSCSTVNSFNSSITSILKKGKTSVRCAWKYVRRVDCVDCRVYYIRRMLFQMPVSPSRCGKKFLIGPDGYSIFRLWQEV